MTHVSLWWREDRYEVSATRIPGAICAFRYRLAVALLKPLPIDMSWLASTFVIGSIFGAAPVSCESPWNCCVKAAPQLSWKPVNGVASLFGASKVLIPR